MRWVRDFLKEVVQLVTPKAVSAAMAAWIMACRICFQVIFFELFIGIFVLKDLFFSVIPDKDEESVGIKMIAFRFFTLFRTTVSFQKDKSLRKYRSTSEQQFYFRKADLYRNTGLLQNNRFISERQIFTEIQVYFRTTVSFQKVRSLQKHRSTSEQPFYFRKTNTIRLQKPGKFRRFLPSCHLVRKPLPSGPRCFSPLSGL